MPEYEMFFKRRTGRDNMMNERIELVDRTRTLVNGHYTDAETKRTVWAEAKSVTRSEYYSAYAAGLNAVIVFRIRGEELGAAEFAEYNGRRYRIQRTYKVDAQYTEITCSELAGGTAGGGQQAAGG